MISNNKATAFVYSLFGFGEKQNKRQYFVVILVHIMAWLAFFSLPLLFFNIQVTNNKFFLKETINRLMGVNAGGFFLFRLPLSYPGIFLQTKKKLVPPTVTYFFFCFAGTGKLY